MADVSRYLEAFDRQTERFVVAIPVTASLADLRRLFSVPPDDPMYDCWPVKTEHVAALEAWTRHHLDLESYDYFLTARTE